ncbi:MAG: leucyl aminopeptidase [Gammaproteobacteria bacterium]|nr:leucyl aminopeptidase [Gammaproteobacteria bacterium]
MEILLDALNPAQIKADCIVIGCYENEGLTNSAEQLNSASNNILKQLLESKDLPSKVGQTLLLPRPEGIQASRILVLGCGKKDKLNSTQFRKIISAMVKALDTSASQSAACCLAELEVKGSGLYKKVRTLIETSYAALYKFDQLKSEKDPVESPLTKLTLLVPDDKKETLASALIEGVAIGNGSDLARDLGNLPGNICTPTYLADAADKIAAEFKNMSTSTLDQAAMEKLGMGSLLSVAKGSREAPKLVVLEYKGGKKDEQPHVLVGKGITFDSGGVSIKPSPAMDEMKFDMCGAASVIGTMRAIGELQPKLNVVALVPSCENMPDGNANKPGDIVTSMSGQTIEVLNTDAEGRLILCDALTYSEKFKPASVIDVATLTGACVVALGKHPAGLLSNNDDLVDDIKEAAEQSGDRVWQMPLWEEYQEQLKSNFADMANIGGRDAGTITAACFLSRFTKNLKWAHLDIAGIAWDSGANKGATGRPVPLLTQYLLDRCK